MTYLFTSEQHLKLHIKDSLKDQEQKNAKYHLYDNQINHFIKYNTNFLLQEYLKNLHDLHEEWLLKFSNDNVLVVEANGNQNELYSVIEKNIDRITGNKNNLSL